MLAFPEAEIPVTLLSPVSGLDPAAHFAVGRALESLREEGVLIIGSGMSYNNMRGFMSGDPRVEEISRRLDEWLAEAVAIADPEERRLRLVDWRRAPGAPSSATRAASTSPPCSRSPARRGATAAGGTTPPGSWASRSRATSSVEARRRPASPLGLYPLGYLALTHEAKSEHILDSEVELSAMVSAPWTIAMSASRLAG